MMHFEYYIFEIDWLIDWLSSIVVQLTLLCATAKFKQLFYRYRSIAPVSSFFTCHKIVCIQFSKFHNRNTQPIVSRSFFETNICVNFSSATDWAKHIYDLSLFFSVEICGKKKPMFNHSVLICWSSSKCKQRRRKKQRMWSDDNRTCCLKKLCARSHYYRTCSYWFS